MITVFHLLNMRTEYEAIVYNRGYDVVTTNSDINSLRSFIKEGHKKNRFRPNYDKAFELAETIMREFDGWKNVRSGVNTK
jgi:hypothetical protein